jgi:hypothetical protein
MNFQCQREDWVDIQFVISFLSRKGFKAISYKGSLLFALKIHEKSRLGVFPLPPWKNMPKCMGKNVQNAFQMLSG